MSEITEICVTGLNHAGRAFCGHAGAISLQAGVLIVVLLCVDLLWRNRVRATLRHWIWMLVFVKLLLPPSLSVPTGIGYWLGPYGPYGPLSPVTSSQITTDAVLAEPTGTLAPMEASARAEMPPVQQSDVVPATAAPTEPASGYGEALTWQAVVFLLWCAGVPAFAVWVIQRLLFVKRLIARGRQVDDHLIDVLDHCRRRMGVRRRVDIKLSPTTFSPAVCGLLRPTILIPAAMQEKLSPENLKAVLIHELAHVRRGDLWVNSLQTVLQIAYFYNPLVWLANAIVRRVREQAVDEMVLVALGAEARSYGNTLIDIAEMAFLRVSPALRLVGVAESRKSLEGRIKHMVTRPIPKSAKVGSVGVFVVAAIGAVLLPMAQAQRQAAPVAAMEETPGQAIATLPDGTTVELIGLCQDPTAEGQQWWRPDGTLMADPEYKQQGGDAWKYAGIGYLLRFSTSEDVNYRAPILIGNLPGNRGGVGRDGHAVVYYGSNSPHMESLPDQIDIQIDVAVGKWKVSGRNDSFGRTLNGPSYPEITETPDGGLIVLSGLRPSATAAPHKALMEVTVTPGNLVEVQLEGTATGGRDLGVRPFMGRSFKEQLTQYTFSFAVPVEEIQSIAVKYRPFHPVVFKNVSLRPGQKTDVHVGGAGEPAGGAFRQYEVNRSVAEFPQGEDFSTPEAAYATINRMDRDDPSAWQRVSVARMADRFSQDGSNRKRTADPEWAKVLSNARIHEVLVWNMARTAVIAELPQELSGRKIVDPFDVRFLQLENGRWLNTGNGRFASIEVAKTHFMNWMQRETAQADAMRDPLRHAGEIKEAAVQLFERLRTADYADILSHYRDGKWEADGWKKFPTQGLYMVHTDYPSFALWCCMHFKDNPIGDVQLGDVFIGDSLVLDKTGWPTVPYKLTLKDGTALAGNLPFQYITDRGRGHWHGMEGIDWHLWASGTK